MTVYTLVVHKQGVSVSYQRHSLYKTLYNIPVLLTNNPITEFLLQKPAKEFRHSAINPIVHKTKSTILQHRPCTSCMSAILPYHPKLVAKSCTLYSYTLIQHEIYSRQLTVCMSKTEIWNHALHHLNAIWLWLILLH